VRLLAGRYEIVGLLGMGGMGAVYRVRDLELGEVVALKVIRPELATGAAAHARFRKEVRLARRVTHRNVARTYDLGDADGHHFLTMELVEGSSLGELLEKRGQLSIDRAVEIAIAMCDGVAAAHEAGVIHRDLKPDNVVIANDGRVVVMDFGVARGTEERGELARLVTGTPAYMAPEQAENIPNLDGRADQYAIGAILFEMLTGQMPFPGNSITSLAQRLMHGPPNPRTLRSEVSPELAQFVMRCLARDRDERYPTVAYAAMELRQITDTRGPLASRAPSTMPPKMAREPVLLAVVPFEAEDQESIEHLGFGLSDGILDALSGVAGLRLCSRGVTARLTGDMNELRERARLLGAQLLLTGSLKTVNKTLRIKLNLATVEDGFSIYRLRLTGAPSDMSTFTEQAASGVAQALGLSPPRFEHALQNPEALDFYLRARREYFRYSPSAIARACELFRMAVERAPDDPVILSAYAMATTRLAGVEVQYAGPLEIAEAAASRAFAIAPNRVESRVALATVALHAGDAPTAAEHAARALRIAPSSPEASAIAARLLLEAGAVNEGLAHMDLALALEPRYGGMRYPGARALALSGDWSESERLLLGPVDRVSPFSYWLDRIRMCYWRMDPTWMAGVNLAMLAGLENVEQQIAFQCAVWLQERRVVPELVQTFRDLTYSLGASRRTKAFYAQLTVEARCYLGGMEDEAASALLRAVSEGLFDEAWMRACPVLECIRHRPDVREAYQVVAQRAKTVRVALGVE
jgi:serine/threonine-protein kinase